MGGENTAFTTGDDYEGPHYWNYRVRARTLKDVAPGADPEEVYDIIEAYYTQDDKLEMWASIAPQGDSVEGLAADLRFMLEACQKPVLDNDELPGNEF